VTVVQGDMLAVLPTLAADSFDACVTDPPYHLASIVKRFGKPGSAPARDGDVYARSSVGFMGKEWDGGDIAMRPETWAEVLRVLKPGAHLVAFGGTRTHHRIWCAIEDAGFEIRDTIMWLYGSGFPKSHNLDGDWEGWGTALKPAFEPIILARKPLDGTVAENVAANGTGALNVDASRVGTEGATKRGSQAPYPKKEDGTEDRSGVWARTGHEIVEIDAGRWPANVIHDGSDEVLAAFPDAPGQQGDLAGHNKSRTSQSLGDFGPAVDHKARRDSGSAARFFYCAKASKADREEGCGSLPAAPGGMRSENSGQHITRRDGKAPGLVHNTHPAVKPTALMQYLVRLVTPPGGVVLDPFTGSGSTGKAAVLSGFGFYGVEREDEYLPIAKARIAAATRKRYDEVFGE
jgi:site-specific DNA-methyltransferase (adenine-specific)